jgi:hypothetical protein
LVLFRACALLDTFCPCALLVYICNRLREGERERGREGERERGREGEREREGGGEDKGERGRKTD